MIDTSKVAVISLYRENIVKAKDLAKKFAKFDKWGNTKWGYGLLNEGKEKNRAEFVGMCGELAFSDFTSLPVDEEVKAKGNDYDFEIPNSGYKIDVKTHAKDYGWHFIKAANKANSALLPLKSDIYVFATIKKEADAEVIVELNGWITKKTIEDNAADRLGPAMKGEHINYYIQKEELQPMNLLVDLLNKYREIQGL